MLGSIIGGIGSIVGGLFGESAASKDRKLQKQFAQKGIQWRAKDAKAAGIHPLAALGASTSQYTPVGSPLGDAVGSGMAQIGQGLSRKGEKALAAESVRSGIEVNRAQAELLKAQSRTEYMNARNQAIGAAPVRTATKPPEGSAENPIPSTIHVQTEDGRVIRMLNPKIALDFGEAGSTAGRLAGQRLRESGTANTPATPKGWKKTPRGRRRVYE